MSLTYTWLVYILFIQLLLIQAWQCLFFSISQWSLNLKNNHRNNTFNREKNNKEAKRIQITIITEINFFSSFHSNKEYFSQGDLSDKDVFSLNFTLTNFDQTSICREKTTFHIYKAVLILCLVSHVCGFFYLYWFFLWSVLVFS